MPVARSILVRGIVQGVGFRPFVYRLARQHKLSGWVLNRETGVEIWIEGAETGVAAFLQMLETDAPPAARISSVDVRICEPVGLTGFAIRESERSGQPSARISPDLPVCDDCLAELFDPTDRRYRYPYINCTNCGPRFSVIEKLPYDRANTTMRHWTMDAFCAGQYHDHYDRRFHAQPLACPACGPHYSSIESAARLLAAGQILAIKGIGGYHLACDPHNAEAVRALRERKFRKEKPFALMARDVQTAQSIGTFSPEALALLCSPARPIVLVPALVEFPEVATDTHELGIMLPYAPLHHLLFAAGAPDLLVMTSANRSSEPIAYTDTDARERLGGIADAFLTGERPIARRVDDSVARAGTFGPVILRRSRGYAPAAVTTLPANRSILAVGADLKNTITLVAEGQAFVSQHIGDLEHYESLRAFREAIQDFLCMYEIDCEDVIVAHDLHPEYVSTLHALELPSQCRRAVQHHRAHIASVMAERQAWNKRAIGISFDGTGFGDDGSIWGGEFFTGSVAEGWRRVAHLRNALLVGGDGAARHPVQCAAGFLSQLEQLPDMTQAPFHFPPRFLRSLALARSGLRCFQTSSVGRLFDTVAALLGFARDISYEGQAAIWLEQLAQAAPACPYPFPLIDGTLDFRPLLEAVLDDRLGGRDVSTIARGFHAAVASGLFATARMLSESNSIDLVVLSGGVFQNELLLHEIQEQAAGCSIEIWTNQAVPPNDGGISFGQAAIACLETGPASTAKTPSDNEKPFQE
ncbi:MAG TPA: carbamoyltransferase HypF [Bryobacteraceae bacterium]|jgi:hydrogenase maturation protein HypF|nr:carbamoyltransferase HypF [Bryobacteraceae bacterium]